MFVMASFDYMTSLDEITELGYLRVEKVCDGQRKLTAITEWAISNG